MIRFALPALLLGFCTFPAAAVKIAGTDDAQVLIFPFFSVEADAFTELTIRNRGQDGKAVRVVIKEAVAGRPFISLNVYLKPGDGWTGRLNPGPGRTATLTSTDESCTFPELGATGLRSLRGFLNSDLDAGRVPGSLLEAGFVEVYEMGSMDGALAADCDAIVSRWEDGIWSGPGVQNEDLAAPTGGLSGRAFSNGRGMTFAFQPTGLAEFRDAPLQTAPVIAARPALSDVRPARVEVLVVDDSAATPTFTERVSTFPDEPIHAVEAALMTRRLRAEYDSLVDRGSRTFAGTMLLFPTQAYGTLGAGYYPGADQRQPLGVGDGTLNAGLVDSAGAAQEALVTPPAGQACDRYSGVLNIVSLVDFIAFSHICDLADAELFLANDAYQGEVDFTFGGELVSAEGHTFVGLPVIGHLFQTRIKDSETFVGAYTLPMDRD